MSDNWRSRINMTGRDALKVAGAVLGLLFGCILLMWVATKAFRSAGPPGPDPAPAPAVPGK